MEILVASSKLFCTFKGVFCQLMFERVSRCLLIVFIREIVHIQDILPRLPPFIEEFGFGRVVLINDMT